MRSGAIAPRRKAAHRKVLGSATALLVATGLFAATAAPAGAATTSANLRSASVQSATPTAVPIYKNTYTPKTFSVPVGQSVTWTNQDDAAHTVTTISAPVKFDSGLFAKGKSFSYTFTKPGVYNYYCAVHPDMTGSITVTDAPAGPARASITAAEKPPAGAPASPEGDHSSHGDTAAPGPANTDNAAPSMDRGDQSMPGVEHGDNSYSSTAPGASDNSVPAVRNAPAAAPGASDPVNGALDPFMKHMQYAHFNKGAGQQVQDISEFDSWAKAHEALFRQMLDYEVGPTSEAGTLPGASVFLQHMDAAHWNVSPMDQAAAIANFDSWNKSHLAMIRLMLDPAVGKSSVLGSAPGTSVFMQHMDVAHWNQSVNGQATAITDDLPAWISSHAGMFQAMAASVAAGSSGGH
jgi:plastocyanin